MSTGPQGTYIGIAPTAARLGVPRAWLRAEAEAGRIPYLRAGRRLLFDIEAITRLLRERAREYVAEESV